MVRCDVDNPVVICYRRLNCLCKVDTISMVDIKKVYDIDKARTINTISNRAAHELYRAPNTK